MDNFIYNNYDKIMMVGLSLLVIFSIGAIFFQCMAIYYQSKAEKLSEKVRQLSKK